jgi:homoserine dehydrogenase
MLRRQAGPWASRGGRAIEVVAVSARDRQRDRGVDLSGIEWFDDPVAMADRAPAEAFIELIGGADGVAKASVETALSSGRHVVTANKALIARHGAALARRAAEQNLALGYEAAVAGGIPIIKTVREGMAANSLTRIYGILNGTCNFILSKMRQTGRSFAEVLEEAQALGYAESDPSFDIDGTDSAHKLSILAALAFGFEVEAGSAPSISPRRKSSAIASSCWASPVCRPTASNSGSIPAWCARERR